ncbi:MAG: hypothetical protein H6R11_1986, partial [Proteobacteria bacterium]|nr:hypothetical protein [Pseudomonadota bacterium]
MKNAKKLLLALLFAPLAASAAG